MSDPAGPDDSATTVVVAASADDVCEVEARILEGAGHRAVRVTDAATVGDQVASNQASALVLDLGAANLDTLQAVRAGGDGTATSVRVVVIGTGPASARRAWQEGADAVLARPFPSTELTETVATVLGRPEPEREAVRATAAAHLATPRPT